MGVALLGSSTQYLTCAAPTYIPTYPFSVGIWARLTAVSNVVRVLWSASDTGTTNNYWEIRMSTTEVFQVGAAAGGAANAGGAGSCPAIAGQWAFCFARFLSATNRRLGCINPAGAVYFDEGGSTTSTSPSGVDTISLGARVTSGGAADPWDGEIAEYFLLDDDIMANSVDSGVMKMHMIQQLAFCGPFSTPQALSRLVEYRGMRSQMDSKSDNMRDWYSTRYRRNAWSPVNTPRSCAPHPPLWADHVGPLDLQRQFLMV